MMSPKALDIAFGVAKRAQNLILVGWNMVIKSEPLSSPGSAAPISSVPK